MMKTTTPNTNFLIVSSLLLAALVVPSVHGFMTMHPSPSFQRYLSSSTRLTAAARKPPSNDPKDNDIDNFNNNDNLIHHLQHTWWQSSTVSSSCSTNSNTSSRMTSGTKAIMKAAVSFLLPVLLMTSTLPPSLSFLSPPPAFAADSVKIASCLIRKCQVPLAKCIANPKCLANVICINTCNGKGDQETACQIECGNLWENDVVGEFNKCAVSDMECVPQKQDTGEYPIPPPDKIVSKFDTKLWNGRWYITAGQNELFDRFPCQVHFFTETKPGTFFGKLNWRIEEPDGEFFTRDALQQFVQDPQQPGHLLNHDNEYLHYQDDWYIIDYEYDDNPDGIPPFAFVYYRGSNDAWDGYGGVVVYTRAAKLPDSLLPRMRAAAEKVHFNFDTDFMITDNTCPVQNEQERALLREKFAGKVVLQTERQLQAQATRVRGNALNGVKAQKLFVTQELEQAGKAFEELSSKTVEFEEEILQNTEQALLGIPTPKTTSTTTTPTTTTTTSPTK